MEPKKGVIDTLSDYIGQVFDQDGDGIVTLKEFMQIFPNMAIPIAIIFVDLLVMVAEYRVWSFGLLITGNPWLAIGFVLVSAIPFLLGQVFWMYPRAIFIQKAIAIAFVVISLYTSAQFGLADLTKTYDQNQIFLFLVALTAGYIVGTLVYIVVDPTIKANRAKRKAQDAAKWEIEKNSIGNQILSSLKEGLAARKQLEQLYGKEEVERTIAQLGGRKYETSKRQQFQAPARQFANEEENFQERDRTA